MNVAIGATIGLVQVFAGHPYKNLRFKELYRGWAYPAMASVAFNTVVFPVYRKCLEEYNPYQAGFIAGLIVSPVDYGFSVGKIRRQCLKETPLKGNQHVFFKNNTGNIVLVFMRIINILLDRYVLEDLQVWPIGHSLIHLIF